MGSRALIAGWFDPDTKARFASAARAQGLSESALLKRLVDAALLTWSSSASPIVETFRAAAGGRLSVRIPEADVVLLRARAVARAIALSSYVTFLLRAH